MRKTLVYLTLSSVLTACSGSGSPTSSTTPGDGADASTNPEGNSGVPTAPGNTAGMTPGSPGGEPTDGGTTSGTETTPSGSGIQVNQFGRVNIINEEFVEITGSFFEFSMPLDLSIVMEQFVPTLDVCQVTRTEITGEIPNLENSFTQSIINPISAGEVLTVSSPAGSYAELVRNEQFGIVFYNMAEDTLSAPAPANLNISIPGDEFAAFANVALPPIVELQVSSPEQFAKVTPSTSYSWIASSLADSFIDIDASALSADLSEVISLECTVADDGSFSFPAEIQSQLGDSFSGVGDMSREVVSITRSGSSVLAVVSSSEY